MRKFALEPAGCEEARGSHKIRRSTLKTLFISGFTAVWVLASATGSAQEPANTVAPFSRDALRRALAGSAAAAGQNVRLDWAQLRRLEGDEVVLDATGFASRKVRIVSVDDTGLSIIDLEATGRPTLKIGRETVREIKAWTGRRGSILGAAIGTGAGVFAGFLTTLTLIDKPCGTSCTDEKAVVGLSLTALPIASGLLGYYLPGGNRTLTTVYTRP